MTIQGIQHRQKQFGRSDKYRFRTHKMGNMSKRENLPLCMVVVGRRRVRVNKHYPIDIMYMGKHCDTYLIGHKQCQQ